MTWNCFSHREYGYTFLLDQCGYLLKQSNFSQTFDRRAYLTHQSMSWSTRFHLLPDAVEDSRPVLDPEFRVPEIIATIFKIQPSILCLQEADLEILSKYRHFLEPFYGSCYAERRNNCQLVTLWANNEFSLESHHSLPLGGSYKEDDIVDWIVRAEYESKSRFFQYSANIVCLLSKKSAETSIVVNSHLAYAGQGTDAEARNMPQRIYQILRILKFVDVLYNNYTDRGIYPRVLIMGDMNTNLTTVNSTKTKHAPQFTALENLLYFGFASWNVFRPSEFTASGTEETRVDIVSPTKLRFKLCGSHLTHIATRNTDREKTRTDGIFYAFNASPSEANTTYEFAHTLDATQKIPNLRMPSDHMPQMVDIVGNLKT